MKRWQIMFGVALIFLGIMALFEVFFEVDLWRFIWPLILVGLGLLLIFRTQMAGPQVHFLTPILGDLRRSGSWEVTNQEIWWFVGTNRLDFTDAVFPDDEVTIKIFGLVAEVKIILPEDVGMRVGSTAFVSEFKGFEGTDERFLSSLNYQSPGYDDKDKRVNLQTVAIVSEIRVNFSLM